MRLGGSIPDLIHLEKYWCAGNRTRGLIVSINKFRLDTHTHTHTERERSLYFSLYRNALSWARSTKQNNPARRLREYFKDRGVEQ